MLHFPTWKKILVLVVCVLGVLYAAPNFLPAGQFEDLPDWMPGKQVNLGLDLQGGSHLLLQVDTDAVIRERFENVVETVRTQLRGERVRYGNLGVQGNAVVFKLHDADKTEAIRKKLREVDPGLEIQADSSGSFTLRLNEKAAEDRRRHAVDQSIEIVRRRIDETGTREPTIQRQGDNRIVVQLPGVDDPDRVKRLLGKTAKLTFHLIDHSGSLQAAMQGRVPPGSMLLPSDEVGPSGQPQMHLVEKRVRVGGDTLVDAQSTFQDNQPVVSFRFDSLGASRFGQATKENVGKQLAIVLDGKVISAPRIREPILGGSGVISGNFTAQSANDLALLLRAGALPAPLDIIEERTVGPGLGRDSVEAGKIASIMGVIFVVAFMIVVYGRFGVMADIGLFFNLALIMALLSGLQATLTLPGIAGIVLTVGMAVDSNVLIFERIREELRAGRTPFSAVEAGYGRALTTIIDSQLTTLIAAALLFAFGSGPIKGFAVTLTIGILTSMFTAVTVTRYMMVAWLRRRRPKVLEI